MKQNSGWVYLLMILPPLFWAGNATLARFVADLIPPVALSFWRWVIALAVLVPFTWPYVRRDWPKIKKGWKSIILLGLLGIASFNTLLYTAAQTTTAINISLTQSVMPAIIVLVSFVLFRERISIRQLFAIALCILGAGYIIIRGDIERLVDLQFVRGDLIMLLAVTLYALYSALLRKRPNIHPLSILTTTFSVGVVFLFPLYLWETHSAPPLVLSQPVILSLVYVAFFPSILAYLCWNRGVLEIGANHAGLYINLLPLFTALLAVFFLGERFQRYHITGICLIFFGLLLFNLPFHRKQYDSRN
ncbi:DMT family transporter [Desulfopila sp. IMCC35008]|uniref:DMT family transporter n=1 Tax=Desulfopila sp. IMCC35008 TaxID=2653858 RepID=UPI0013D88669|nr:DMT family transporter [Desulfopila sp. IMCC35008]